jgi:ABC-type multidrug transport system ATPase subunit
MIVIASIHQPSTTTLLLFDNVLLLAEGKPMYYGPPANSIRYFRSLGHPPPPLLSPAEFMLELTNTDFDHRNSQGFLLATLKSGWETSLDKKLLEDHLNIREREVSVFPRVRAVQSRSLMMQSYFLLQRMAVVILYH